MGGIAHQQRSSEAPARHDRLGHPVDVGGLDLRLGHRAGEWAVAARDPGDPGCRVLGQPPRGAFDGEAGDPVVVDRVHPELLALHVREEHIPAQPAADARRVEVATTDPVAEIQHELVGRTEQEAAEPRREPVAAEHEVGLDPRAVGERGLHP